MTLNHIASAWPEPHQGKSRPSPWSRAGRLGASWHKKSAVILVSIAIILCSATYAALRSAPPFGNNSTAVIWLLNIDLIALGILGVLIARRVILLYNVWKRGIPGARLHLRFVYIFGLLAMVPAVVMTVFSLFFFHYGVQTWFSDRVKTAVNESQAVAESYLREHHQVIRADIMAMAKDLDNEATLSIVNPQGFSKFVQTQAMLRGLTEVIIFDQSGDVSNEVGAGLDLDIKDFPLKDGPQITDAITLFAKLQEPEYKAKIDAAIADINLVKSEVDNAKFVDFLDLFAGILPELKGIIEQVQK